MVRSPRRGIYLVCGKESAHEESAQSEPKKVYADTEYTQTNTHTHTHAAMRKPAEIAAKLEHEEEGSTDNGFADN